ncbi:hypothetical protein [Micromonospora sicca]|uniref:hypothetical protein n=1 Tax=Micromonospora sicca TaxID=2202420 RepID=UPI0011B5B751|nr:hypothetical protein [Micromonospora sp. 4G51]
MTFQVAVSAMLLAAGLSDPELPVVSVMPERLEDIDCHLADGTVLLVQAKEHGVAARATAAAALADILTHAANAVRLTADSGTTVRLAIVTNGKFGSGLPATGWSTTLADALAVDSGLREVLKEIGEALKAKLREARLDHIDPMAILSRTHLVAIDYDLGAHTRRLLETGLGLQPAVADIVRRSLLVDLGNLAAAQREASIGTAGARTLTDLRANANRVVEVVDLDGLDEAIVHGVCEPVDFMIPSPDSLADFFAGVSVKPGHVVAGLDVVRHAETIAILNGLNDRREVVIAGPSGAGKSCLLWRAARLLEHGPQLIRIKSVADQAESAMLLRHVRRMMPDYRLRVVVCVDDLGTPAMAAWPGCRDELLQIPGVSVIGAVRLDNAAPGVTGNAVLVDPRLTDTSASDIYDAMAKSGIPTALAKEEALAGANGLLMEFIALTTTGQRIRAILSQQVAKLSQPGTRLAQRLLRLICASHTIGFTLRADTLAQALSKDEEDVQDALRVLQGEHLALSTDQVTWQGVHDLRAEILLELLHTPPPPILAETYAQAIRMLPPAAQAQALRRAANRIASDVRRNRSSLAAADLLAEIESAMKPFAHYVAGELEALAADRPDRARIAAGLLESADRLDVLAYVHAVLPLVQRQAPPTADVYNLLWLSYTSRSGAGPDLPGFEPVRRLGAQMPEPSRNATRKASLALPSERLFMMLSTTDTSTAVRLAEAAEGLISLTGEQASGVFHAHVPAIPVPAGDGFEIDSATLRGRLIATLAALSQVSGPAVGELFGAIEERAADAVAHDAYGATTTVEYIDAAELPAAIGTLARGTTFEPGRACVIRAVQFMRNDLVLADDGSIQTDDSAESPGAQLVAVARRLFDACPEADLLRLELWQASQKPPIVDGIKNLRAGALPRNAATRGNVTLQAVASESLSAESWTARCRAQAIVAAEIVSLITDIPGRLGSHDNLRRRADWMRRVDAAAAAVAALPLRPPEPMQVLGAAAAASLAVTGAAIDEASRAAKSADRSRASLAELAGSLQQLSSALNGDGSVRTVGFRFFNCLSGIERALSDGTPLLSGVGETFPRVLGPIVSTVANLLIAADDSQASQALRRGTKDMTKLQAAVDGDTEVAVTKTQSAVREYLDVHGVTVTAMSAIPDDEPLTPWMSRKVVAAVDAAHWDAAHAALYEWIPDDRRDAGVQTRVMVICAANGRLVPVGITLTASSGTAPMPRSLS